MIQALINKNSHVPFRNSKLTYLLQSSLAPGNGSKVAVICCVSPAFTNLQETKSSLEFTHRCRDVTTKPPASGGGGGGGGEFVSPTAAAAARAAVDRAQEKARGSGAGSGRGASDTGKPRSSSTTRAPISLSRSSSSSSGGDRPLRGASADSPQRRSPARKTSYSAYAASIASPDTDSGSGSGAFSSGI